MSIKYNIEDLKYRLPDYISKNIENKELVSEIEKELENNPEFKNEFDNLKRTFNFISSVELESPPESYFANLSVKINQRIEQQQGDKNKLSILERLSLFWKILIPAIPIVILAIILLNNFMKNDNNTSSTNELKKNEVVEKKNETIEKKNDLDENKNEIEKIESENTSKNEQAFPEGVDFQTEVVKENKSSKLKHNKNIVKVKVENNISNNIEEKTNESVIEPTTNLYADNLDNNEEETYIPDEENLIFKDDENESLENEFLNLTPEQQKEILENLNKAQI